MAVRHISVVVARYLSMVKSNSESENNDELTDDDSDGNEAGSKVEATEGNKHMPQHMWDWQQWSFCQ